MDKLKYFASYDFYEPAYLDALIEKINGYRVYCRSSGKIDKWRRSIQNYYGVSSDGTKSSSMVTRGGDNGQLIMAKVSDYRNIVQHQLILITSQRPAGEAMAINSDTQSLHSARIGTSLVEYYLTQANWEQKFVRGAESALVADEGFAVLDWDATAGDIVRAVVDENGTPETDDETGEPTGRNIMSGDLVMRVVTPWNMARDPYLSAPEDMHWGIVGYRDNKFDLASKYPNQRDSIVGGGRSGKLQDLSFDPWDFEESDQTAVYCLYHEPTPACKNGRLTLFVEDAILLDTEFPYSEFNIYRMSQNDILDSCFGYSNNNDILALEEVTDALHSAAISNNVTFAAQAIVGPKGADIQHNRFGKGFVYFEVEPQFVDKIKPLQLTRTAPETYSYIQMIDRKKEIFGGINSVVRGDPEGALKGNSGSALALIQAQALQFNSGGQRSYYHILSKACTGMIKILQRYADSERVVRIAGKVQAQYLNEFKYDKSKLQNISSVVFQLTDPISKSLGGKQAIADNLLQKEGMIKNASQYINIIRTGSLDVFTEDDEIDELSIKEENEVLRGGEEIPVIATENHEKHIQSHMSLISSPQSKKDDQLVIRVQKHIQAHIDQWNQLSMQNPALLVATKQKVLPPPPGMAPPPGQGQPFPPPPGQVPPGPQNGPSGNVARMNSPETPLQVKAGEVRQPQMPVNPGTRARVPMPQP